MASNIDMVGASFGGDISVTDPRWSPTDVVDSIPTADFAGSQDIRTLDARLLVLNAGYWNANNRLFAETVNDKIYWLRLTQYGAAGMS